MMFEIKKKKKIEWNDQCNHKWKDEKNANQSITNLQKTNKKKMIYTWDYTNVGNRNKRTMYQFLCKCFFFSLNGRDAIFFLWFESVGPGFCSKERKRKTNDSN